MIKKNQKRGLTLIETIIYTGLLAFLCVLVVRASLSMHETYVYVKTLTDMNNAATLSMERLTRYIRDSESINEEASSLDTHPGVLVINIPTGGGGAEEVSFSLDPGDRLVLEQEGEDAVFLTPDHLEVSNLIFREITTAHSTGVKIELSISNTIKGDVIERSYFNSIIMRGSY